MVLIAHLSGEVSPAISSLGSNLLGRSVNHIDSHIPKLIIMVVSVLQGFLDFDQWALDEFSSRPGSSIDLLIQTVSIVTLRIMTVIIVLILCLVLVILVFRDSQCTNFLAIIPLMPSLLLAALCLPQHIKKVCDLSAVRAQVLIKHFI